MARKRKKKLNPKTPPLSAGDKALYTVMMVVCVVGPYLFTLVGSLLVRDAVYASGDVAAYRNSMAPWIFYWVAGWFLTILFDSMRRNDYPVLGNRRIKYGPPKYHETYPLLGRYESDTCPGEEWKKKAKRLKCLWLLAFAVLLSGFLLIGPEYVLMKDGGVEVYSCLGRTKEIYTAEQITALELVTVRSNARYEHGWHAEMRLEMAGGKEFSFHNTDFKPLEDQTGEKNRDFSTMQRIKDRLPATAVTIGGVDQLPEVVEDCYMTPTEEAQLYALFEAELP